MVVNAYEAILRELSDALKISPLVPDANNTCLIKMKEGVSIYIEPDHDSQLIVVASELGNIAPGAYRTNYFRAALQTNVLPSPNVGSFGWSRRRDQMLLFIKLPVRTLDGQKLYEIVKAFTTKAVIWKKAIDENQVPVVQSETNKIIASRGGLFGLRP